MAEGRPAPLVEELVPAPDPVRCCERLRGLPYRLFLDSAVTGTHLGRYSFLTADPVAIVRSKGRWTERLDSPDGRPQVVGGDGLQVVRALLAPCAADPVPGLPPFQGGAAGYVAYDWGRMLERLPGPRQDDLALPDVVLGVYDWVLAWDHQVSAAWVVSTGRPDRSPSARAR
jgi:para-aminobenzoate synthetase component 1